MLAADGAIRGLIADPHVWTEEMARDDAAPLPWPIDVGQGHAGVLRWLTIAAVDFACEFAEIADGAVSRHQSDPFFQVVLRIAHRAVQAADVAMRPHLREIKGQPTGWREFMQWLKRHRVDGLMAQGLSVEQAASRLGIGKSQAYEALRRRRP